jgi:uncharacterized membrane protein
MSDDIDLTPEAVERLASHIQKSCACALGANAEQPVADTLRALSARLAEVEAERDEMVEVLNSIEVEYGLTYNGNLWRFWAKKAREVAQRNREYLARAEAAEAKLAKVVDALRDALSLMPDDEGPEIDFIRTTLAELEPKS